MSAAAASFTRGSYIGDAPAARANAAPNALAAVANCSYTNPARMTPRVDAVLFDFGGTLDSDGKNWLDRFYELYEAELPRDAIRRAFDFAEAEALRDKTMCSAGLDEMLRRHVGSQLTDLGLNDPALQQKIGGEFAAAIREIAARNVSLLADVAAAGLRLGVISNGCGNTAVLCDELGFAPFLSIVLDSQLVGMSKPDPAFFGAAADQLQVAPASVLMVGDSLGRDIRPAKQIGMQTAWLAANAGAKDPAADYRIGTLAELRDILLPIAQAQ
jgi:putative hydrolase of the HAD superfamily